VTHWLAKDVRKALRLPRVNLFIADDVGLGKTIEAGLIARELLLRKKVREIVVSCPPSMLLPWQEELQNRFGLRFEVLNKYIKNVRRDVAHATAGTIELIPLDGEIRLSGDYGFPLLPALSYTC